MENLKVKKIEEALASIVAECNNGELVRVIQLLVEEMKERGTSLDYIKVMVEKAIDDNEED